MTRSEIAIITSELGPIIKAYVEQATAPLVARNKELELRLLDVETRPAVPPERGERGEPGTKGDSGASVASMVISADHRLLVHFSDGRTHDAGPIPAGPPGVNGKDGAAGLHGKDGAHGLDGKDGRDGLDGKDGAPGLNGKDGAAGLHGKDAEPVDVEAVVTRIAALIPTPKDGRDGVDGRVGDPGKDGLHGKDGRDGLDGKDGAPGLNGKDGTHGLNGKDGVGVMDAVLDRAGHLVLTLSDGRTKDVGIVAGRDGLDGKDGIGIAGAPGRDGRDVSMDEVKTLVLSELQTWPRPKDGTTGPKGDQGNRGEPGPIGMPGEKGLDGKDGLGFDETDLIFDETKGYVFRLRSGDRTKDYPVPWPWDAQVWQAGRTYLKAASVTWDGHFWIAQCETAEQPGEGSKSWRLAVRRGKQGKEGKPGKDFTPRTTNTPPLYGSY